MLRLKGMVAMTFLLLFGQARTVVSMRLHAELEGIRLEAVVQVGHGEMRWADASKAEVVVRGPDGNETVRLTHADWKSQYPNSLWVNVERSPSAGWRTMTIESSGLHLPTIPPGYKESLRYYLSAKSSRSVDELRKKRWIGAQAWPFGSALWEADKTICWNPIEPVTILDIKRVNCAVLDGCGCPVWNVFDGWHNGSFFAGGYLDVTLLLPKGAWSMTVMGANANSSNPDDRHYLSGPTRGHYFVADWWQLERAFQTNAPSNILQKEPGKVREAFVHREMERGMPRSLVALLVGDPDPSSLFGDVWRRKSWNWTGGPFNGEYIVSFDKNGRVNDYGVAMPNLP